MDVRIRDLLKEVKEFGIFAYAPLSTLCQTLRRSGKCVWIHQKTKIVPLLSVFQHGGNWYYWLGPASPNILVGVSSRVFQVLGPVNKRWIKVQHARGVMLQAEPIQVNIDVIDITINDAPTYCENLVAIEEITKLLYKPQDIEKLFIVSNAELATKLPLGKVWRALDYGSILPLIRVNNSLLAVKC